MSRMIVLYLFMGTFLWAAVYLSIKEAIKNDSIQENQKYKAVFTGNLLPIVLIVAVVLELVFYSPKIAIMNLIFYSINFITIFTIYYIFIYIFLRLFRKHLHPLIVSTLWMLPNVLYFYLTSRITHTTDNPIIIEVSKYAVIIVASTWFAGFISIILYKIYEHYSYRNFILEDAIEIKDENILKLFKSEIDKIEHFKAEIPLLMSNNIQTPLTIGVRKKVVVLPNNNYTEEELKLIFKHEIIHIARNDVITKVYLIFCNAVCWFNPLLWFANKKCSEDLELSCDYSVLSNVDEITRKKYANLVLKTASSEKGFTTCLSTNAKSLQYRLQNILRPKYKMKGGLLIFVLIVMLIATWGNFSVAIKGYNGYEELFNSKDVTITNVYPINGSYYTEYFAIKDEDKIIEYLSNLELSQLPTKGTLGDSENKVGLQMKQGSKEFEIVLYDQYIELNNYNSSNDKCYYVKDGIDLEYLNNYIIQYPSLTLKLLQQGFDLHKRTDAVLKKVESNQQVIYELDTYQEFFDGVNYYPSHIILEFEDEVMYDIEVIENRENEILNYTISKDSEYIIETPKEDVEYEIKVSHEINNEIYTITYNFDFHYVEGMSMDETILNK